MIPLPAGFYKYIKKVSVREHTVRARNEREFIKTRNITEAKGRGRRYFSFGSRGSQMKSIELYT